MPLVWSLAVVEGASSIVMYKGQDVVVYKGLDVGSPWRGSTGPAVVAGGFSRVEVVVRARGIKDGAEDSWRSRKNDATNYHGANVGATQ